MARSQVFLFEAEGVPVESLRRPDVALRKAHGTQVVQSDRDLVPPGGTGRKAFEDRQGAVVQRLGLVEPAEPVKDAGKSGDVARDFRMVSTERALTDVDGAARVGFAPRVLAARMLEASEVVVKRRKRRMLRSELDLEDGEGAQKSAAPLSKAAGVFAADAEIVQHSGDVRVPAADVRLRDGERAP